MAQANTNRRKGNILQHKYIFTFICFLKENNVCGLLRTQSLLAAAPHHELRITNNQFFCRDIMKTEFVLY